MRRAARQRRTDDSSSSLRQRQQLMFAPTRPATFVFLQVTVARQAPDLRQSACARQADGWGGGGGARGPRSANHTSNHPALRVHADCQQVQQRAVSGTRCQPPAMPACSRTSLLVNHSGTSGPQGGREEGKRAGRRGGQGQRVSLGYSVRRHKPRRGTQHAQLHPPLRSMQPGAVRCSTTIHTRAGQGGAAASAPAAEPTTTARTEVRLKQTAS